VTKRVPVAVGLLMLGLVGWVLVDRQFLQHFGPAVLISLSLLLYFLPSILAVIREKSNVLAIFALNLLLGWSVIGWVGALVWALTKETPRAVVMTV